MSTDVISDLDFKTKLFDFAKNDEWVYRGPVPAIVDFYAQWCAPCKVITPALEAVEKRFAGQLEVFKVNIDFLQDATSALGIQTIPTLLYLPVGGPIQRTSGALSQDQLLKNVKAYLGIE